MIDARLLCTFFNSAFAQEYRSAANPGAAQKHFNVRAAKDVLLHLPPLAEQQAHRCTSSMSFDDETQRLESIYQRKLAALESLKKSLLHQAFTGQL